MQERAQRPLRQWASARGMQMTQRDKYHAALALVNWLESQEFEGEEALDVMAMAISALLGVMEDIKSRKRGP